MAATVHRFPSLSAATAAYTRLIDVPEWARTGGAPIAISDLPRVLKADLRVQKADSGEDGDTMTWIQLPDPLPRGWYVLTITHNGLREQAFIQVTDLATYAMVTTTRTVVWVNSVTTADPVRGATLKIGGSSLGKTDADGLQIVDTPAAVIDAMDGSATFLTVSASQGRQMFVPLSGQQLCYKCDWWASEEDGATGDWWTALMLDRHVFRSNDQANVWGVVRERDGTVPDRVQVRLETADSWLPNGNVPVAVVTATPASTGMFIATLAVKDLPVGDYSFVLRADGVDLASAYARVGPIVKPAYRLELSARDRAVLSGSKIRADVAAEFFDGTPVAGVDLKVSTEYDDGRKRRRA